LSTAGLRRLAWAAAAFALFVIVFGAFRVECRPFLPDWPTCYGHMTWPTQEHEVASANNAFPDRPVESARAGRNRFIASLSAV
jgi:cytochrome c oxidase assembly protein subunit 15